MFFLKHGVYLAEFMHESIVFCSACTILRCRRKESSRLLFDEFLVYCVVAFC